MSQTYTVQSRGIYHGLPTYPDDIQGLTAIVRKPTVHVLLSKSSTDSMKITGANGISGYHMLKVLSRSPRRWAKIYCLSRRPPVIPGGLPENAEFVSLDFLREPKEIAEALESRGVKA